MNNLEKNLNDERLAFLESLTPEKMLRELLAKIHKDGGHHTEKVGLAKSVLDAEEFYDKSPNDYLVKAEEFIDSFGQEKSDNPFKVDEKLLEFRIRMIFEELEETLDASLLNKSTKPEKIERMIKILDGLLDLQYVLSGAVVALGFKDVFDEAFEKVHQSNMSKFLDNLKEAVQEVERMRSEGIDCQSTDAAFKRFVIKRLSDGKILKPSRYIPVDSSLRSIIIKLFNNR